MMSLIYGTSDELVKVLKKTLRPHKSLIREMTTRNKYFPFVSLKKCPQLDKCVRHLQSNDFKYNESIDRKINKICRKYSETNSDSVEELQPPEKKRKMVSSLVDLNLINDENEDLDFEDDATNKSPLTNGEDHSTQDSESDLTNKLNSFVHNHHNDHNQKTNTIEKKELKAETNGMKSALNGFPTFNNNNNNNNFTVFKIPKKSSQTIESVVSHVQSLTRSAKKQVDAFNYLSRYLTEEQWLREDIMELLITIAKNMVVNNDFNANVSKFNELINKIKSLKYNDDDFWDQIIFAVDKKKSDTKNIHQINSFLSDLHDYMVENKINARVVCTEAVIVAFRVLNNHPTAKELLELQ